MVTIPLWLLALIVFGSTIVGGVIGIYVFNTVIQAVIGRAVHR